MHRCHPRCDAGLCKREGAIFVVVWCEECSDKEGLRLH